MQKIISQNSFVRIFFFLLLSECVIGGGGRFTAFGPLSLRMIFFGIGLLISFIYFLYNKTLPRDVSLLVMIFTILIIISSIYGVLNNAPMDLLLEDIKAVMFFYIIIFFSFYIHSRKDIENSILIIKAGSVFLALIYFLFIVLLLTGTIDFQSFWEKQSEIGEVLFRGETLFFYKGFLYLCIGYLFFISSHKASDRFFSVMIFIAIVLTLTRGFLLFIIIITLINFFAGKRSIWFKYFVAGLLFLVFLIGIPIFLEALGEKSESDLIRIMQLDQVFQGINIFSLFFGHGFGVGIPVRPIHMEISYLEIFQKQGLFGLLLWISLAFYPIWLFLKIRNKEIKNLTFPFILGVIFIFLQSGTNPYLNNSIGLSFITLSIAILSRVNELDFIQDWENRAMNIRNSN